MATPQQYKDFYDNYQEGYKLQKNLRGNKKPEWVDHMYGTRKCTTPDLAWADLRFWRWVPDEDKKECLFNNKVCF